MVSERSKYTIKDIFDLSAGGDVDKEHFSVYKTSECCYPIYSNSLENHGLYGYTSNPKYKADSVTITGRGSVGHAEYRVDKFDAIIRLLVLEPKDNKVCAQFVADYINNCVDFPLESTGVPQLTAPQIMNIELELPQYDEQKDIATLLSDVNNLIDTLDRRIQKKKAIKQGAMQELLTGKKRLPGFSGEWKSFQLRDLGEFLKGSGISRAESNTGKIPAVRYGELYTHHHNYVLDYISHISKEVAVKAKHVFKGDILFAASGETKEEIGKCAAIISQETVYAGGDIFIFRPSVHLNPIFMGTLLNTADICRQRAEKGQGDAVVHIHADSLGSIRLRIPEISEQDAISDILFEMDKEIKLLEQKLAKYRQVKQGMMQQLLTGKIRLV